MQVYFYCNYSNSKKGFYVSRITENGLEEISLSGSDNECESLVERFFSYDCFRALWLEIPKDGTPSFMPEAKAGIFGLKGFTGEIENRKGYLNFAFVAQEKELQATKNLINGILSDINGFVKEVFSCLYIGEKSCYALDVEKFRALIFRTQEKKVSKLPVAVKGANLTRKDMLKFAVTSYSWDYAQTVIGLNTLTKKCPGQVIDEEKFKRLFGIV